MYASGQSRQSVKLFPLGFVGSNPTATTNVSFETIIVLYFCIMDSVTVIGDCTDFTFGDMQVRVLHAMRIVDIFHNG